MDLVVADVGVRVEELGQALLLRGRGRLRLRVRARARVRYEGEGEGGSSRAPG